MSCLNAAHWLRIAVRTYGNMDFCGADAGCRTGSFTEDLCRLADWLEACGRQLRPGVHWCLLDCFDNGRSISTHDGFRLPRLSPPWQASGPRIVPPMIQPH